MNPFKDNKLFHTKIAIDTSITYAIMLDKIKEITGVDYAKEFCQCQIQYNLAVNKFYDDIPKEYHNIIEKFLEDTQTFMKNKKEYDDMIYGARI